MTDLGGEVHFEIVPAPSVYAKARRSNIDSVEMTAAESPRGMKFFGEKINACKYFTEKYDPAIIFRNWEHKDSPGAKKGPSVWEYVMNPT
jgi:hypothetical protein